MTTALLLTFVALASATMKLVLFDNSKVPADQAAVCLDGTPSGFYVAPGATRQFILYIAGGGWCYTPADCAYRAAHTDIGSSQNWTSSLGGSGILSPDATINPIFSQFTRVYVPYCDGFSFMGHRASPVTVGSQTLYFRGHANLQRTLNELDRQFQLKAATDVLVAGCSAGGLSTILHVDRVRAFVPNALRVAGVPDSGFFLNATNIYGQFDYGAQMAAGWQLHNASAGANAACLKALGNTPSCSMAPYVTPLVSSPLYVLNSFFDSWQMGNVVGDGVPETASWQSNCAAHGPTRCNATELAIANAFARQLTKQVQATVKLNDGFALESCWSHCMLVFDKAWAHYKIGPFNVQNSVTFWWQQLPRNTRNRSFRLTDCSVTSVGAQPCNPTCV